MLKVPFWAMLLVNIAVSVGAGMALSVAMAEIFFVYRYGMMLRAVLFALVVSTAMMFLGRSHVGTLGRSNVDPVIRARRYFRDRNMVYAEKDRSFTVRLGKYAAVRLFFREGRHGTEVFFTPYGTQNGLGLVAILVILGYTVPVALVMSVKFALSARQFARASLEYLSTPTSSSAAAVRTETTKELLETSLAEARRVALESYEAKKSGYQDCVVLFVVLVVLSALIGMEVLLLRLGVLPSGLGAWLLCTAGVSALVIPPGVWAIRRRFRPAMDALDDWVKKLELQLLIESSGAPLDDESETSFEVLAAVGKELPSWMSQEQRSGIFFHPWTASLMILLGSATFTSVLALVTTGPIEIHHIVPAAMAIATGSLTIYLHLRIKRKVAEERARFCDQWRRRSDAMMSDMDSALGGR